jgi:hypothetical protein
VSYVREQFYKKAMKLAGKPVPRSDGYVPAEFPHYHVFVTMQRARPSAIKKVILKNAEFVAAVLFSDVLEMSIYDYLQKGFNLSPPSKKR